MRPQPGHHRNLKIGRIRDWLAAMLVAAAAHAVVLIQLAVPGESAMLESGLGADNAIWGMPSASYADVLSPAQAAIPDTPFAVDEVVEPTEAAKILEAKIEVAEANETRTAVAEAVVEVSEPEPVQVAAVAPLEPETVAAAPGSQTVHPLPAEMRDSVAPEELATAPIAVEATEVDATKLPAVLVGTVPEPAPVSEAEAIDETQSASAEPVNPIEIVASVVSEVVPPEEVAADATPPLPVARPPAPNPIVVGAAVPATTAPKPAPVRKPAPAPQPAAAASAPSGQAVGAAGQVSDAVGRQISTNYSGRVAAHLERTKRYPRAAEQRRLTGAVTVRFTLGKDGSVGGSSITRSSGHNFFDEEVMAMLRRANPFPAFPPEVGRKSLTFTVTIRFKPR